jgi:hypothetical protein
MSNQMNPWLASIYGTDGADDLEKTAQAHLLQKLAAEQNLDISQFTPEELEQLVQELAADGVDVGALMQSPQQQQPQMPGMGQPQQPGMPGGFAPAAGMQPPQPRPQGFAPAGGQPQIPQGMNPQAMQQQQPGADAGAMQKEAQAKFEEADLLGRVMAHAYTDELEKIASHRKTAGKMDAAKSAIKGAAGKARDAAAHAHGSARGYGARAAEHVKGNKGAYAGAGAAAAGGFAAGRMSKKASAFEKLAEEHAAEILSATGYDPSTGQDMYGQQMLQNSMQQGQPQQAQPQQPDQQVQGQPMYPQQQQQGAAGTEQPPAEQDTPFTEALDSRALELLAENGYNVNEILARVQMQQRNGQPQA